MKKLIALVVIVLLFCLVGCSEGDKYNRERFYGVVRFSEESNQLVVYIPSIGDVAIPESEGCCSCFDGHEPNDDYSYQLKVGDLVKINFRYEKSWDDNSVKIMESYPAKFDRKAGRIEALRENISFFKDDSRYVFSFPSTAEIDSADVGDTLYFIYHEGKNGRDFMKLYAQGEVISKTSDIITVNLTICDDEKDFLKNYCNMTIELEWEN